MIKRLSEAVFPKPALYPEKQPFQTAIIVSMITARDEDQSVPITGCYRICRQRVSVISVPFLNRKTSRPYTTDAIRLIANRFSVSREVIIRRLLDTNRINSIEHDTYADEFRREVERDREKQSLARQAGLTTGFRPSVSREAIDRTSSVVCKALYYGYGEEMYSKRDIAQHLGIAQKHVDKFLAEVSAWSR